VGSAAFFGSAGSQGHRIFKPADLPRFQTGANKMQDFQVNTRKEVICMAEPAQADLDNHANQCNSNNAEYWNSRDSGDDSPCDGEFEWMPDNGD
jgi:hypothetical protein